MIYLFFFVDTHLSSFRLSLLYKKKKDSTHNPLERKREAGLRTPVAVSAAVKNILKFFTTLH